MDSSLAAFTIYFSPSLGLSSSWGFNQGCEFHGKKVLHFAFMCTITNISKVKRAKVNKAVSFFFPKKINIGLPVELVELLQGQKATTQAEV